MKFAGMRNTFPNLIEMLRQNAAFSWLQRTLAKLKCSGMQWQNTLQRKNTLLKVAGIGRWITYCIRSCWINDWIEDQVLTNCCQPKFQYRKGDQVQTHNCRSEISKRGKINNYKTNINMNENIQKRDHFCQPLIQNKHYILYILHVDFWKLLQ